MGGCYQQACERVMDRADKERSCGDVHEREHKIDKARLDLGHLKYWLENQAVPPRNNYVKITRLFFWEISMLACLFEVPVLFTILYMLWGINMTS